MFIAKNIKLFCSFIIVILFFIILIFYNSRNSTDIEFISTINNDVNNKININDANDVTLIDEIATDNGKTNEITDNNEIRSNNISEEEPNEFKKDETDND